MSDLYQKTLTRFKDYSATAFVPKKVVNAEFAKKICSQMLTLCHNDPAQYEKAIEDFVHFSEEFLTLQIELDKSGKYWMSTYKEALEKVYHNPDVMENRYLNGLFLSQAFWPNHYRLLSHFMDHFCIDNPKHGKVMEVPAGTGIFISEFVNRNPGWNAVAYDISKSSCEFSRKIIKINSSHHIPVVQRNVFDIGEEKFDRIICGELLEHLEEPELLLKKLKSLISENGKIYLTTAIWAANIDHIYLFKSANEVREMLGKYFTISDELVINVFEGKSPEDEKTPINYACILTI